MKQEKLVEELGDLLWYVSAIATKTGFDLGEYNEDMPGIAARIAKSKKAIEEVSLILYHNTRWLFITQEVDLGIFFTLRV